MLSSTAVQFGHEATVELLLERDNLSYDIADKQCRTPLLWAVALGLRITIGDESDTKAPL